MLDIGRTLCELQKKTRVIVNVIYLPIEFINMVKFTSCVFVLPIMLIHLVVPSGTNIAIRKCCPKGSRLLSGAKIRCTTLPSLIISNTSTEGEYPWIPTPLEGADGNATELDPSLLKVSYGLDKACSAEHKLQATLYYNVKDHDFKLFANNGSLVQITRFNGKTFRMGYFSSKSFCVDSVRDEEFTHAAKVCFCVEKMCILKCCGHGKYLNAVKNICFPAKETLPNYSPVIYDKDLLPMMDPPSNMYLMSSLPVCKSRGFYILNGVDQSAVSTFYIQSNGNAVLINDKTNTTISAFSYCVDLIETDAETISPNLAVCQTAKRSIGKGSPMFRSVDVDGSSAHRSTSSSMIPRPFRRLLLSLSIVILFVRSFV